VTYEIKLQVGSPHVLRDHLRAAVSYFGDGSNIKHTLQDALAQIDEQVKPAVEEPLEFGSVVRAWHPRENDDAVAADLWQHSPMSGKHYWENCNGVIEIWSDLVRPEVLRIGIGEPEPLAQWETELLGQQERREIAAAVLGAMDVDQYLIDAVANARPR
jgi:hypothetical protein